MDQAAKMSYLWWYWKHSEEQEMQNVKGKKTWGTVSQTLKWFGQVKGMYYDRLVETVN